MSSDHASAMHMNAHMFITHIHAYRCIARTATVCLRRLGGGTRPQSGVCRVSRAPAGAHAYARIKHTIAAAAVARSEGYDGTGASRHRTSQHKSSARHDRRGRCAHQGVHVSTAIVFFCFWLFLFLFCFSGRRFFHVYSTLAHYLPDPEGWDSH